MFSRSVFFLVKAAAEASRSLEGQDSSLCKFALSIYKAQMIIYPPAFQL